MEIITLEQFQNDFNKSIEKSLNQKYDIESQIKEILEFVNTIPNQRTFRKPIRPEFRTIRTSIVSKIYPYDRILLSNAFYSIKETGNYDLVHTVNDSEPTNHYITNTVKQAFELFEYYKWLNELLNPSKKVEKKTEELSHKAKILALYYLGLDMRKFGNNLQSAKILSKILGLDESNTKRYLTYFDGNTAKVKTKENLNTALELFEHKDFKEIHSKIKKDLEK